MLKGSKTQKLPDATILIWEKLQSKDPSLKIHILAVHYVRTDNILCNTMSNTRSCDTEDDS